MLVPFGRVKSRIVRLVSLHLPLQSSIASRKSKIASTPWCNGNTAPFGGVIHGSNPCGVAPYRLPGLSTRSSSRPVFVGSHCERVINQDDAFQGAILARLLRISHTIVTWMLESDGCESKHSLLSHTKDRGDYDQRRRKVTLGRRSRGAEQRCILKPKRGGGRCPTTTRPADQCLM